jgi:hypothetical protein
MNIVAAKAKRCIVNIAPAGCGKSAATDTVVNLLKGIAIKYTSVTLAGLGRIAAEMSGFAGHVIIDDLGAEKSLWSRTATISVLTHLVYTHNVDKITQTARITIRDFFGSAAINIQPIMMQSIVQDDDWVAVVRDKCIRYYHLIRPIKPKKGLPAVCLEWGVPLEQVEEPTLKGAKWYQLLYIGLIQWSYARCLEHIPAMLKALAALDGRKKVTKEDYNLLYKLMQPMQLERYLLESTGFEAGRIFYNDIYCILVELASHKNLTIETIATDYKVHPRTVYRLLEQAKEYCYIKTNSPHKIMPTETAEKILKLAGVKQKW